MTGMIIVNYNDFITTKRLLDNVKNYKCLTEIVVVDNKSTDDSLSQLQKLASKKITIIDSGANKGYSYALNVGCKYLIEKYQELNIIISNSDIIIDSEEDIKELVSHLNSKCVVVGPTIIQNNEVSRGFKIPTVWQDIKQNIAYFGKKILARELSYPNEYYHKDISKVDTVSGCFFLISSKHVVDMGYFDENVFLYYEENIMGVKTKRLNKNIIVCNNVDVVHDHSVSIDKSLKRIKKYDALKRSQAYFEKTYNKAGKFSMFLLYLTRYLTRILLLIKYSID